MYWTTLLLPVVASAAVIEERQLGGGSALAGIDELQPKVRANARRTITKMGPYTIPASTSGKGFGDSTSWGSAFFGSVAQGLCNNNGKDPPQDCTMLAGRVGVMWADGSNRIADPSTGIYIHHILSSNVNKRETPWFSNCNNPTRASMNVNGITGGSGFLSTGEDSAADQVRWTDENAIFDTGYHVKATDRFNYWAQIVNYNKQPAKIYVTFDTEWVPGLVGQDTKTIVVSATCGGGRIKMSTEGATNTTSGKFYMMEDGRIIGARGHIHDGGEAMHMFINDKYICSSSAVYGTRNEGGPMEGMGQHGHGGPKGMVKRQNDADLLTISRMSDCPGPFKVKKGDSIVLTAEYNLQKHPLRVSASGAKQADVMAMMGFLFSPGLGPIKLLNGTIVD